MKKTIKLNKKTIRKLQLKLKPRNDRKVAPGTNYTDTPSKGYTGAGCTSGSTCYI